MEDLTQKNEQPDSPNHAAISDRRSFLSGIGALGIVAAPGILEAAAGSANQGQAAPNPTLSSVARVNIIRNDTFNVPNGKENIVEYTVADHKGVTQRHSYNVSRIDGLDGTYTTNSNFRVEEFAAGQSVDQEPVNTKTFQMTVYGIKGKVVGNRRNDTITTTMVSADGSVSRTTQVVPVRLDVSEFAGLSGEALITKMGNIHFGKDQLSK